MRALTIALALFFMANPAHADIGWKVDRFGPGSVMVMKDRSGATTHVSRGTDGNLHVFDVYDGRGASAEFVGRYKTTARGDVVETVAFDGAVTRFVPNRCNRTEGTCRFTVIHPDGFAEPRTRVTRATRGGLRYQEFGLDGLIAEGVLTLDGNGAAKGGWTADAPNEERKLRTKRVLVALK
ncbi:hypothetical protein [Sagittula stellata]|uniref:Uncharacterized protein n=1 Tax=Sagittula stellata (strain ATCC 700073 / DSM 11524 / E-37) TaxID=388399 RepID=A3K2P9_SAGS3|nr:hypothetical protein [Sagittula stellata]EBA08458.1 hypothetical protein SSE37_16638 [Sagittula stellata E-37]